MKRSPARPPAARRPASRLTDPVEAEGRRKGMSRWRAVQREQFAKLIAAPAPAATRGRRADEREP